MKALSVSVVLVLMLAPLAFAPPASAADSPQFRGTNRDGKYNETGLLKTWPEAGPPVVWVAHGLGKGYSTVSVVGGKIYATGMADDLTGSLFVLDAGGKIEKTMPYGKDTDIAQAPGPRSTPTIDGERAYLISGPGVVYCMDVAAGKKLWEANILERFGGKNAEWHLAESLLIDGDRLICTPGGSAGVAALNKMTGETIWTADGLNDAASYCSPAIVNHNGRRLLLTETSKFVVGIDADTGKLLWTHPHETKYDIHAVTPIYDAGLVYFTGGYGSGGGALALSPDGSSVTLKWEDKTLDSQHHGVVLVDGYLYGCGHSNGGLTCLDMATGKVMWTTKDIKGGAVVYADGMLYVYEGPKAGIVSLVKAAPAGFERAGKFEVKEGTDNHWAHPVISNGRLYIRHGEALIAYDVAQK
jgi:outer membrane protein assembly factor BamB